MGVFAKTKIFAIFKKQEVYFLVKPFFMPGRPPAGLFFAASSKALARPFGSRMLWELDRGQHFLPKPVCKQFRLRTQQPAPAGVSQSCGLAIPNTGSGAGHDSAHPTHSRVVTPRPVSVHPICSGARGMCGGPGPVLSLRGCKNHPAQILKNCSGKARTP